MKRPLSLILILSLSAAAAEPALLQVPVDQTAVEAPAEVVEKHDAHSSGRFALAITSASLVAAGTTVGAGLFTLASRDFCTKKFGHPNAMCIAGGVAIGGAAQLLFSYLVIPELFRISGDDPSAVRAGWWKMARWPALAMAVSSLAMVAATTMETKKYGSGQALMIGSAGGAALSSLSIDVMGIIGAVKGAKEARKKKRLAELELQ